MIDEMQTKALFGYMSSELSRQSHKKVVVLCEQCNNRRVLDKCMAIKAVVCIQCQRANQARKIAKENRFGRKHSEVTKLKMRMSRLSLGLNGEKAPSFGCGRTDEHKKAIAKANCNRVWTIEAKRKISDAHKGAKLSPLHRAKMGASRTGKRNPNYGRRAAHGKGDYYIRKDGSKVWMRSSWEIKVAGYLDANGYNWEYEPEAFPIEYQYNGTLKSGTYRPDFKVKDCYWEVKGYWRDDAKEKYKAFMEQYSDLKIELLDREKLTELGVVIQ